MSYLADKKPCRTCGDLYDDDLLDESGECRGCASFDPDDHEEHDQ